MREYMVIDNVTEPHNVESFKDLVRRRKPDVVVVSGYDMSTAKLRHRIKEIFDPSIANNAEGYEGMQDWDREEVEAVFDRPVVYMYDQVAKVYQHTKRAATEFPELSVVGRYCVGLARYTQSPVNEFAAIGSDISAVLVDEAAKLLVRMMSGYKVEADSVLMAT